MCHCPVCSPQGKELNSRTWQGHQAKATHIKVINTIPRASQSPRLNLLRCAHLHLCWMHPYWTLSHQGVLIPSCLKVPLISLHLGLRTMNWRSLTHLGLPIAMMNSWNLNPPILRKMNQAVMICLVMIATIIINIHCPKTQVLFLLMSHLHIKIMIPTNLMKTGPIPSISTFPTLFTHLTP